MKRSGCLLDIPHVPYQVACGFQRILLEERVENKRLDSLLLVEHESVFTMGRRTKEEHWKPNVESIKNQGIDIYEIERGGSVTYHGPGQIVGYPIFKLKDYCPGPKNYVGKLQDVIICVLAEWNIQGVLRKKFPGVWVERAGGTLEKITAIGVRITRGVTMHGWSLNVNVDLKPFALITPCGIEGCHVTSMAQILGEPVDVQEVRKRLAHHFADVFRLEWKEKTAVIPKLDSSPCLTV